MSQDKLRRRSVTGLLCASLGIAAVMSIAIAVASASAANDAGSGGNSMSPSNTQEAGVMDQAAKARIFHDVLNKLAAGEKPDPVLLKQFVSVQNANLQTGPKLGQKVPDFTLPDQDAQSHSLHDLMGANGLLLVFVRSADW
jgi:hypothetical protein